MEGKRCVQCLGNLDGAHHFWIRYLDVPRHAACGACHHPIELSHPILELMGNWHIQCAHQRPAYQYVQKDEKLFQQHMFERSGQCFCAYDDPLTATFLIETLIERKSFKA